MKALLWTTGVLLTLVLIGVWLLYEVPGEVFERQVYPDRAVAQGLKVGQASCMHCPMYYRFDTSHEVIQQILSRRELESVAAMPEYMEQTIALFDEGWWIDSAILARARKNWVLYKPVGGGESQMRLALVDGTTVYFASTGFPPNQQFVKVPLAEQAIGKGDFLHRRK
ncbi:MAG: hypothetical protein IPP88_19540 [Betaproteobacteria bacterium]|nr:hypothetical protein [Betaproteobacteria bacterium]